MHPVSRSNRGHIMNKIKMYNTNLTTMDAEIFKQIKNLAAKLNKDKNELLEEEAQDLIKKYKNQKPSLGFSDRIWGNILTALIYIAVGLLCSGWLILLILSLSNQSEQNKQDKQTLSLPLKAHPRNPSENDTTG